MEKKKGLFGLSLPLQFLIYYVASYMLFFFGFLIVGIKIDTKHLALACLAISTFTALLMTGMIWTANISDRFYESLRLLEKEANEVKSIGELISIELRKKAMNGGVMISECQRIKTIIDTRLKYEFKV